MRYCYHNKLYRQCGEPHGVFCDPVRRPDGKCVVTKKTGKQLVDFGDGARCWVIRRNLRIKHRCDVHSGKSEKSEALGNSRLNDQQRVHTQLSFF